MTHTIGRGKNKNRVVRPRRGRTFGCSNPFDQKIESSLLFREQRLIKTGIGNVVTHTPIINRQQCYATWFVFNIVLARTRKRFCYEIINRSKHFIFPLPTSKMFPLLAFSIFTINKTLVVYSLKINAYKCLSYHHK